MPELSLSPGPIYYETYGEGDPIVALHDGAGSAKAWKEQIPFFSKHFTFTVYDRLGHGRSGDGLGYGEQHFEDRAGELKELVSHLGFDSVNLCGLCEGGVVATLFASLWPDSVRTLVCQGVGYYTTDKTIAQCERYFRPWSELDPLLQKRLIDYHGKDRAAQQWETLREAKHYVWDRSYDLRPRLSGVEAPTLIMGGDRDPFFGLEHPAVAYRDIRNAELCILPGAGHFPNEEVPTLFNEIVIDFFKRQTKRVAREENHDAGPTVRP
jgi:pimeloyl-ACP methyl ester carboxylesterase